MEVLLVPKEGSRKTENWNFKLQAEHKADGGKCEIRPVKHQENSKALNKYVN